MTRNQVESSSFVHDHSECRWWRWWDTTPWNQSGTSWSDTDFMLDHAPLEERFILLLAEQEEQFRWRALGLESFRWWWYEIVVGWASESAVVAWEKEPINSRSVNCAVIDRAFFVSFYINILFFLCRDTTLYPPPVTSVSSGGRNGYNLCSTRAEWKLQRWGHMCMQVGNTIKLYLILL